MHNHDKENRGSMVWMMVPCLLLLGVIFFGGEKLSSNGYFLPGLLGIFIIAHIWMMFRGHGKQETYSNASVENKDEIVKNLEMKGESKDTQPKKDDCCH